MHTKLVKNTIEHYLKYQDLMPAPEYLTGNLASQHACYVYIFENPGRHFRVSFGTTLPRRTYLAQEIISNTVSAMLSDSHRPIRQIELPNLVYSVAVLGPLERIGGDNHLDPRFYGLYIRSDRGKTVSIMPGRVGMETGADQIATAIREADINTNAEAYTLYRFSVTYYN